VRIGVISDTHGLVRDQAVAALRGSEMILHAGDVGSGDVLDTLGGIAPVIAVRGNIDRAAWAEPLPETRTVEVAGRRLHLLHDIGTLDLDPAAEGIDAVIFGHSHQPLNERRDGVLYLNPGSAGPRRFRLPICLARLDVGEEGLVAEITDLQI
jgi:putative phosphoesterase